MKRLKIKWNEMATINKVLVVLRLLLSIIAIILGFLKISGTLNGEIYYYVVPLIGVYLLTESFDEWKKDRDSAALNIILAVLAFMVTLAVWFG